MITTTSEALVRAAAVYLPIVVLLVIVVLRRPGRDRITASVLATAWNVPLLFAVNLVAVQAGWWGFSPGAATVAGIPADLWLGWALLWGAVPVLATERLLVAAAVLVAVDLVLMPLAAPVVVLHDSWLIGEAVAAATCLVPALLLGRWTLRHDHVNRRAGLQVIAFTGLLLLVLPALVFAATGEGWSPLLDRPRWQIVAAAVALAPVGAMALQAVMTFARHGGTPVPLDPPSTLVTSGPYAFVANPMQIAGTIILMAWGALLESGAVVAAGAMAGAFSAGFAAWTENGELTTRFGGDWLRHRARVRCWFFRWRPMITRPAVVFVAASCDPCSSVGGFISRRHPVGLEVRAAEQCGRPLRRITYVGPDEEAAGIAAIARSLEHVNLAWAAASWIARLPVIQPVLQLIADAVGGGPQTWPAGPPERRDLGSR